MPRLGVCWEFPYQQGPVGEPFPEPFLRVTVEPVEKFRFRYKTEAKNVHGPIKGRNSSKSQNGSKGQNSSKGRNGCKGQTGKFPSVQLVNWTGPAWIRCSLFTGDSADRTPSCHQLVVKENNGTDGTHSIAVNDGVNGDTAWLATKTAALGSMPSSAEVKVASVLSFAGMGIFIEKTVVRCREFEQRLSEEKRHKMGPGAKLSEGELQETKREAKAAAANEAAQNNTVCLRFECFDDEMRPICTPVFSENISNTKSPLTNKLQISRIDKVSGSCLGDEEVFIFVEKVSKKHIKVRFYEPDDDDDDDAPRWEAWGSFEEQDVHHQYAIAFRTPPYRRTDIEESVSVFVELLRTNDKETSERIEFQYKPCVEQAPQKRKRAGRAELDRTLTGPSRSADPMICNGTGLELPTVEILPPTALSVEEFEIDLLPEFLEGLATSDCERSQQLNVAHWDELDGAQAVPSDVTNPMFSFATDLELPTDDFDFLLPDYCNMDVAHDSVPADFAESFQERCSVQDAKENAAVHLAADIEGLPTLATLERETAACQCQDPLDWPRGSQQQRPSDAAVSSSDSDSEDDFEDALSCSEFECVGSKPARLDSISSLSATTMQRLCDFLDERDRWKPLAEALDFGFLVNGIVAENVDCPGKTLVNFLDENGVGMDRLRAMLTEIASADKVAAIFQS